MEKYFNLVVRLIKKEKYSSRKNVCYYGNGIIRIKNKKIDGVIAYDYLEGIIDDEMVNICFHVDDYNKGYCQYEIAVPTEYFYLPAKFEISSKAQDECIMIEISNQVNCNKRVFNEAMESAIKYLNLE